MELARFGITGSCAGDLPPASRRVPLALALPRATGDA